MTVGVPAGEGWYTDAPTAPLPAGAYTDSPSQLPGPRARRRRLPRWLRRTLTVMTAAALVIVAAFTALLIATPSVSNAPALARTFALAHDAPYPGPPVPSRFAAALVSTEDHRFYSEPGVDPFAIARVIRGRLTGGPDQGGATLYQQLAKMLYTPGRSGPLVQAEQVALGVKLELSYSKAEILRLYADVAYFGHGYYGLAAASCGYFGVAPAALTWPQAAMLAGLVQAPSTDNPIAHYGVARAREAHVLGRLAATGMMREAQASQAYRQPVHLAGGQGTRCAP